VEIIPVVEAAAQGFGQGQAHSAAWGGGLVIRGHVWKSTLWASPFAAARDPGYDHDGPWALGRCWRRWRGLMHGVHGMHGRRDCCPHAIMGLHAHPP
jgi:hypothetical protein